MRETILNILPDADQGISYGAPAFKVGGKTIAGFVALMHHLSYLPHSGSVFVELSEELKGYLNDDVMAEISAYRRQSSWSAPCQRQPPVIARNLPGGRGDQARRHVLFGAAGGTRRPRLISWDCATGSISDELDLETEVMSPACSPDGRMLAALGTDELCSSLGSDAS